MVILEQYVLKSRGGTPVMAFTNLRSAKSAQTEKSKRGIKLNLVRQVMTEESVYEC